MITRTLKSTAKKALEYGASLFGKKVLVADHRSDRGWQLFDYNMLSNYRNRGPAVTSYETSMHHTGMAWSDNAAKRFRFHSLYQVAKFAQQRSPGNADVVECGCWRGHSAHMIATILKSLHFDGTFHIFDSFQGFSQITSEDYNERSPLHDKEITALRNLFAAPEQEVRDNLAEFDFLEFYPGWIPERFPEVADKRFVFVNIDVDLYHPTRDCIEFFLPRLVDGGVMVFNDYGYTQFPGATAAVDEELAAINPSFFYEIPTGGAFLIK